jgi:hypothetical protein
MAEKYCGPLRPPAGLGSNSTITRAQLVALLTDVVSTSTPAELAAMGLGAGVTSPLVNNNNGTYTYTDEEGVATTFVSPRTVSPKLLPLATNLVFDAELVKYARGNVPAAGMVFTPNTTGAIVGSTAVLELVATGGTEPDFSAFKESNGSAGWDNTNGTLNLVILNYFGPNSIWVTIVQENEQNPGDTIAPVLVSASVQQAAPNTVLLTFSEALGAGTPAASAFTISGKTVTAVAKSGSTVTLTVNTPFVAVESQTVSYTPPGTGALTDAANNPVAAISNFQLANPIPSPTPFPLSFTTRTPNITVAGTTFTETSGVFWTEYMLANPKLPANGDGWYGADIGTGATAPIIGFNATDANEAFTNFEYFVFVNAGTFRIGTDGSTVDSGIASQRYVRLRRTAGTIVFESSPDNTAWTLRHTWAGTNNADLFPVAAFTANGVISAPVGLGVALK